MPEYNAHGGIYDNPSVVEVWAYRDPAVTGPYKLRKRVYSLGTLVSEDVIDVDDIPYGGDDDNIIGLLQTAYPSTYNIVTSISELNDGNKISITRRGLDHLCANCTSLESVDVKNDFDNSYGPGWSSGYYNAFAIHDYAFYNCTSLVSVDFDDLFDPISTISKWGSCSHMFEGCSNLTTITTSDDIIYVNDLGGSKDMFKGCTSLTGLKLYCASDLSASFTPSGSTIAYDYAYEYLGLNASQFTQVSL